MRHKSLPSTHHPERIQNFTNLFRLLLFFGHKNQTPEKIHEKVNSAFHRVLLTTSSYTDVGYQNWFYCSWLKKV